MKKEQMFQLRQFVKLKKYPPYSKLKSLNLETINKLIDLANSLEISNELTVNRRVGSEQLGYDDNLSPLGKDYNQKHVKHNIEIDYITENFSDISDVRFAILAPYAVVPRHLDDPAKLNLLITLSGNNTLEFDDVSVDMGPGDVFIVNPAYYHTVRNGKDERIALLLKVDANEQNLNLLRT